MSFPSDFFDATLHVTLDIDTHTSYTERTMKQRKPRHASILFTVPWRCDDEDCAEQWHKGAYWIEGEPFVLALGGTPPKRDEPEYHFDAYSDGDHEIVDPGDVPTLEAVEQAWRGYHEDCAATGKDPLGEYIIPRYHPHVATWQVVFQLSIVGVVLQKIRRRGRGPWRHPKEAGKELRDYLDVTTLHKATGSEASEYSAPNLFLHSALIFDPYCGESPTFTMDRLRRLAEADPDVRVQRADSTLQCKLTVKVTEQRYRKPSVVEQDIKRAARKALHDAAQYASAAGEGWAG